MKTVEYLIKKLEELGINDFFGLPSDYNFEILYTIENNANTNFINCTNELNAGYAADGYAREKGYGAVVTTYGTGELCVANAIAGAYAENVPIINIVGVPATKDIANKSHLHHTFIEPQPFAYAEAFKHITETTAFLNRDNAKLEIDRVLKTFVKEKKPVYIAIPIDIAQNEISEKKVNYSWTSDENILKKVVELINNKIEKSKKPVILGDILIKRFDATIEYKEFVEKTGFPATNFLMGTNLIDYDLKNYLGTYFSKFDNHIVKKYIDETDCLISVGPVYSNLNSFGLDFPHKINSQIAIYGTHTFIDGIKYENVKMSELIEELTKIIKPRDFIIEKKPIGYEKSELSNKKLDTGYFYPRLQEFIKENDIIIADSGTIQQGIAKIKYPPNCNIHTQALWNAIGWATPATLGMCIAKPNNRVILLTGDGAHQTTALELGNMFRYNIKPTIIVLNNNGYSVERLLANKFDDKFNDIIKINYAKFARCFEGDVWATKLETQEDFDKALKVTQIMNKLCYIEACIDKLDVPALTKDIISDFKSKPKVNDVKLTEKYNITKPEIKLNNSKKSSFGTKVHESWKG